MFDLLEQAFDKWQINQRTGLSPIDCIFFEKESGSMLESQMKIKELLQDNHGTEGHPLILKLPVITTVQTPGMLLCIL